MFASGYGSIHTYVGNFAAPVEQQILSFDVRRSRAWFPLLWWKSIYRRQPQPVCRSSLIGLAPCRVSSGRRRRIFVSAHPGSSEFDFISGSVRAIASAGTPFQLQ
jgi:hypothetical protein